MKKLTMLVVAIGVVACMGQATAAFNPSDTIAVNVTMPEAVEIAVTEPSVAVVIDAYSYVSGMKPITVTSKCNVAYDVNIKTNTVMPVGNWNLISTGNPPVPATDEFAVGVYDGQVTPVIIGLLSGTDLLIGNNQAKTVKTSTYNLKYYGPADDTQDPTTSLHDITIVVTGSKHI